jgi:regulator of protease activity HflC (stomatin/prohibitin superfamily)
MTMAEAGSPGRAKTNWGRFLVTLIVGGVPTAICYILDWWWGGTVCLLLTLFLSCFSFPSDAYPLVFTVYAMIAIGLLAGARLDVVLHDPEANRAWWQSAFVVLGGLATGTVIPVLFWFVAIVVSTKWLLGLAESYDIRWSNAFTFVALRAFGFARPHVQVENGEMTVGCKGSLFGRTADPELFAQFGGPAMLVVGEGNVVVLERGGKLSRILGQGTYALKRNEWFKRPVETKGIHDLRGGAGAPIEVKQVQTRDGVPLEFRIAAKFGLELKEDTDKRPASRFAGGEASSSVIAPDSQYPVYEATIRKAVYKTGDRGWKTLFPTAAAKVLRDVVATYTLDQIFGMAGAGHEPGSDKRVIRQIEEKVKEGVGVGPAALGLNLAGVAILEVTMPDDVREVMNQRWTAPLRRDVKLLDAETKRMELLEESKGRADFIHRIEEARMYESDRWLSIIERLKEVLPEVESSRVAYGFVSVIRDLLSRVGQDEKVDRQKLGELRRLLAADAQGTSREPIAGDAGAPGLRMIPGQTVAPDEGEKEEPKS